MVNWMTHNVYFHFPSISKSFLLFLCILSVCSPGGNCTQEKTLVPIILNSQKIKQELGDLLGFKNLQEENYFEAWFRLCKKNELGQLKKRQQVYLSEKEGKAISAIRNTVVNDAEKFGLVPILELTSDKESTMDQQIADCNKVYDIATYNRRQVVSRPRSKTLTNLPTFRFDCSRQKRMKQWNQLPMSTILWTNSKNGPKFWETLYSLRTVMYNNLFCSCFLSCKLNIDP